MPQDTWISEHTYGNCTRCTNSGVCIRQTMIHRMRSISWYTTNQRLKTMLEKYFDFSLSYLRLTKVTVKRQAPPGLDILRLLSREHRLETIHWRQSNQGVNETNSNEILSSFLFYFFLCFCSISKYVDFYSRISKSLFSFFFFFFFLLRLLLVFSIEIWRISVGKQQ
jgi:hypothetical protein